MSSIYFSNARLVLPNQVLNNSCLLIEDGIIRSIDGTCPQTATEIDLRGQTLIPGIVDLHCDALEKEAEPRPNVFFPPALAVSQIDRRNAQAGVTTAFHAISFAGKELGVRSIDMALQLVTALRNSSDTSLIHNRIHCRYEVTDAESLPVLEELLSTGSIDLLSLMDHTPGQGQFKSPEAYGNYLAKSYGKSAAEIDQILDLKLAQQTSSAERIERLALCACKYGVPLASHDDDSSVRVQIMKSLGVRISEFPINIETAKEACDQGLKTVFGAPNVLRGKSQSGSVRAHDALAAGVASCLCSDYHPGALLPAILRLEAEGMPLADAVRLVTCNPAQAAGLTERGSLTVGCRADLVAFVSDSGVPQVTQVWRDGIQTYLARWRHAA
jgi:alpha-D-ribose 1-methylphosphonate 5-triphosphate diphosphatase